MGSYQLRAKYKKANNNINSVFLEATKRGELHLLKELEAIQRHSQYFFDYKDRKTTELGMYLAATSGHTQVVRYLSEQHHVNASVRLGKKHILEAIIEAINNNKNRDKYYRDTLDYLLSKCSAYDLDYGTVLNKIISLDDVRLIQSTIKTGVNINRCLARAVSDGKRLIAEFLINQPIDLNYSLYTGVQKNLKELIIDRMPDLLIKENKHINQMVAQKEILNTGSLESIRKAVDEFDSSVIQQTLEEAISGNKYHLVQELFYSSKDKNCNPGLLSRAAEYLNQFVTYCNQCVTFSKIISNKTVCSICHGNLHYYTCHGTFNGIYPNGKVEIVSTDGGSLYKGEMKNGTRYGFGILYSRTWTLGKINEKVIYEGNWLDGSYHGYGKTENYEGYFNRGVYDGAGRRVWDWVDDDSIPNKMFKVIETGTFKEGVLIAGVSERYRYLNREYILESTTKYN